MRKKYPDAAVMGERSKQAHTVERRDGKTFDPVAGVIQYIAVGLVYAFGFTGGTGCIKDISGSICRGLPARQRGRVFPVPTKSIFITRISRPAAPACLANSWVCLKISIVGED